MKRTAIIFLCFVFLLMTSQVFGGTTGKISGRIIDAATQEPLMGVNILVESTMIGAASDEDGQYFILNVPPGIYSLVIRMMGYETLNVSEVRVSADKTTIINANMKQATIEGAAVTIVAARPVIKKDVTAKETVLDEELLENVSIANVTELLTLESNVVDLAQFNTVYDQAGTSTGWYAGTSNRDRGIPNLHIRGGRVGEIQYMVDGLSVSNPIFGEMAVNLNKEAIKEMQVLSGSFNAEYGSAQSGVVNIVTKEAARNWAASANYRTTSLAGAFGSKADELLAFHEATATLGGPLWQDISFYASFREKRGRESIFEYDDIVYDPSDPDKQVARYGKPRYINPLDTIPGWRAFGFDDKRDFTLKISVPFSPNIKLNLMGSADRWYFMNFDHYWQYKMGSRFAQKHSSYRGSAILNHMIGSKTFYTLGFSVFHKKRTNRVYKRQVGYEHLTEDEVVDLIRKEDDSQIMELLPFPVFEGDVADTSRYYVSSEPRDPYWTEFRWTDDRYWTDELQTTYNLKFDITSQLLRNHEFKTGFDLKLFHLDVDDRSQVYPGGPSYTSRYDKKPFRAGFYVQDKIEYNYLIINAGLRLDYENTTLFDDAVSQFWSDPTEWKSGFSETKSQINFSPRLGVSLPVTDKTIFFYNFGVFYQMPEYSSRFSYSDIDHALTAMRPMLGNPNLDPEKTTSYELGLKHKITHGMGIELNLWLKKTTNMVGALFVPAHTDVLSHTNPYYTVFTNLDYSHAKGLEITLNKRFSDNYSFRVNYSYQLTKGIREDAWNGYYNSSTERIVRSDRVLDNNRPHSIRVNFFMQFAENANILFRNTSITVLFWGQSGFPYTPQTELGDYLGPVNSMQRPWTQSFDLRMQRRFDVGMVLLSPYMEIDNIFDFKNPVYTYEFNGTTDQPSDGWRGTTTYRDRPDFYGPRRRIMTGLKILFK